MNKTKIVVPVLIVCAVAVVGIIKNKDSIFGTEKTETAAVTTAVPVQMTDAPSAAPETEANVSGYDFSLIASDIDIAELSALGIPVLIDFGSETCGPCLEMADDLERVSSEVQGRAVVKYVDIYENPEAAADVPVRVTPTQLLIDKNGNPYVPPENAGYGYTMYSRKDTNEHVYTVHEGALDYSALMALLSDMGMSSR